MKALLASLLSTLVLAAPASATEVTLNDKHSSRSLKVHPALRIKDIVPNYKFFIAIGRCEQPAPAAAQRKNGTWPKKYAWGINWTHPGPTYPGGLGVWYGLWHEKGIAGTDLAPTIPRATPIEQMIHAQRIVNRYGVYAWGCAGRALAVAPYHDLK